MSDDISPTNPSDASPTTGCRLEAGALLQDTYRIDHLIATGGMGEVYRATHQRLEGSFAVKVLHHDLVAEDELLARFETEAKIMASLHHPNIVQVFDFNVTADGTPYLVMELAEGSDLRAIMSEQRTFSPYRVVQIVEQTASALGAAHAHGVVHRDLKPENVLLVPIEGQSVCVKIVDFGISKSSSSGRALTREPIVFGTPEFMSPEQAQGMNDDVDARADQFSLGALAYTLLTGREPFRGPSSVQILYQVVHEDPMPLASLCDWTCERTQAVLAKAMAKDRNDRYDTVFEFAAAFKAAVEADLAVDPTSDRPTPLPLKVTPIPTRRARPRLSSELDLEPAGGEPAGDEATDTASDAIDTEDMLGASGRPRSPRPGRAQHHVGLAAMTFGAVCLMTFLALQASFPIAFAHTSERVISAYDTLSTNASRVIRLGKSRVFEPEAQAGAPDVQLTAR